jgi:undecaprenyl-diphosphatase
VRGAQRDEPLCREGSPSREGSTGRERSPSREELPNHGPLSHGGSAELPLRHALALGLLHGPAELLPISSSGHTTLIPWLAGWPYGRLEPRLRKSFEVALHAGTVAALLLRCPAKAGCPRFLAAAVFPPALAGYALHERIERRLGTPLTIAGGLVAGSLAMACGELRARQRRATRRANQAGVGDGLALGIAQTLALIPGVSRSGATFAVARARGFTPEAAEQLSLSAGLPVLGGAALLQTSKLARRGLPGSMRSSLAVGGAGAFLSTLLASALLDSRRRSRAAIPASLYRVALASLAIARSREKAVSDPSSLSRR